MPRYYFHVRDAMGTIDDTEGLELATLDAAEAEAQRSAESIAEQRKYMPTRCHVVVADEEQVVIAVVPVPR